MQRYHDWYRDNEGRAIAYGLVTVYNAGTTTLATIFNEQGAITTPVSKSNPFTTDADGYFSFAAPGGSYDISLSASNQPARTIANVALYDAVSDPNTNVLGLLQDSIDPTHGDALIAVKQPVTGATARTQHSKNSEMLSILDFGAVGDNSTDDTAALSTAISTCGALNRTLYIPAGIYRFTSTITINKPVRIVGEGRQADLNGPCTVLMKHFNGLGFNFANGSAWAGMSNLILDCDFLDSGDGIYIDNGRCDFDQVTIHGHGRHGLNIKQANASRFSNLALLENGGDGLHLEGDAIAPDDNGMFFGGLDIRINKGYGIQIEKGFSNFFNGVTIQGNALEGIRINDSNNLFFGVYSENNKTSSATPTALVFGPNAFRNLIWFGVVSDATVVTQPTDGRNTWIVPGDDVHSSINWPTFQTVADSYINGLRIGKGAGAISSNTTCGNDALIANTSGGGNSAFGGLALNATTTGGSNSAFGYASLFTNVGGAFNTAFGRNALRDTSSGDTNTALGYQAGRYLQSGSSMTGLSNTMTLGCNSAVSGSNQVQIGDSATTTYVYGTVQNRSDARDKADIRDTELGLDFINRLRPVDYRWDMRVDYIERNEDGEPIGIKERDGSKKRKRFHHGLIAQEVKQACDELGIDFGGYQDHSVSGGMDVLSIGYDELIAPLIRAVQELKVEVDALKSK